MFIIWHCVQFSNYKSDCVSTHIVCFRIRFNYILSYIQFYIKDTPHRFWSIHMERWLVCPISIQNTIKFSFFLSYFLSSSFLSFGGAGDGGDMVSLWLSGYCGIHSQDQAGFKLRDPPASASQVQGLKACATTPSSKIFLTVVLRCLLGLRVYFILYRYIFYPVSIRYYVPGLFRFYLLLS